MPGAIDSDVVATQRPRAAGGRGPHRLGGRHAHLAHRERDHERHRAREARARVAVARERDRDAGVDQPARVGVGLPGRELHARQQRRDGVASPRARRHPRRRDTCSGRRMPRPARPRAARRRRGRAGCRAPAACRPCATPAARMRSLSSRSNAPRSQNTSIQRLCGAHGVEHLAAHEVDVLVAAVGVLGRHDVRAEERDLGRDLGGEAREPRLVVHGEPVAGLDLERRRALRAQLGHEAGEARAQLVVASRRAWPRRSAVCRRRHTACPPSAPRTRRHGRRRTRGGCGCRRSPG